MGVQFKELGGSPTGTFTREGFQSERQFLCAWENLSAIIRELMGFGTTFGDGPANFPGLPGALVKSVKFEPFEKCPDNQEVFDDLINDINTFSGKYIQLDVSYEQSDDENDRNKEDNNEPDKSNPGSYLQYSMDFATEYMTVRGPSLKWESRVDAPVPPEALQPIRISIIEHKISWHRVINPPWVAIGNQVGTLNNAVFLGAPIGCVLFDGCKASKEFVTYNDFNQPLRYYKLEYLFREKRIRGFAYRPGVGDSPQDIGWNYTYRGLPEGAGNWDRLMDQNGKFLYPETDFAELFKGEIARGKDSN